MLLSHSVIFTLDLLREPSTTSGSWNNNNTLITMKWKGSNRLFDVIRSVFLFGNWVAWKNLVIGSQCFLLLENILRNSINSDCPWYTHGLDFLCCEERILYLYEVHLSRTNCFLFRPEDLHTNWSPWTFSFAILVYKDPHGGPTLLHFELPLWRILLHPKNEENPTMRIKEYFNYSQLFY
jgi:hypothetical protein